MPKPSSVHPGNRFGRLLVESMVRHTSSATGKKSMVAVVLCDCGNRSTVNQSNLRAGATRSCGCIAKEMCAQLTRTHGMTKSSTWTSWQGMKKRCTDPRNPDYTNYGGRGISICDRWIHSFENFLADMGERPDGRTLDRIDSNGNYEPQNCRWATSGEQARNRRAVRLSESDAARIRALHASGDTASDIARMYGVSHATVSDVVSGRTWRSP